MKREFYLVVILGLPFRSGAWLLRLALRQVPHLRQSMPSRLFVDGGPIFSPRERNAQ